MTTGTSFSDSEPTSGDRQILRLLGIPLSKEDAEKVRRLCPNGHDSQENPGSCPFCSRKGAAWQKR